MELCVYKEIATSSEQCLIIIRSTEWGKGKISLKADNRKDALELIKELNKIVDQLYTSRERK